MRARKAKRVRFSDTTQLLLLVTSVCILLISWLRAPFSPACTAWTSSSLHLLGGSHKAAPSGGVRTKIPGAVYKALRRPVAGCNNLSICATLYIASAIIRSG